MTDSDTRGMPGEDLVVGIDIGGTGTRFVAAHRRTLAVTRRATVPTPASGSPAQIMRFLRKHLTEVTGGQRPVGVGIGASGPVDLGGVIRNPDTLPAFTDLPILDMVGELVDGPVVIDNDAVCAAIAEHHLGAAQGSSRSLHITLGTGIGVCLLDHGQPFRLHDGTHPEGGHLTVATATPPCYCGRRSCWEQAASRRTLQRRAAEIVGLPPTDPGAVARLSTRAGYKDPIALAAYEEYGEALGEGLATLLGLYGPEVVVIGGSASEQLDLYAGALTRSLAGLGSWVPQHRVVKTALDDYGGAIGGTLLAVRALEARRLETD